MTEAAHQRNAASPGLPHGSIPGTAPSTVAWVLFDAVGTLMTPCPAAHQVYHRAGQTHGSQLSVEDVRRRLADQLNTTQREATLDWTTSAVREHQRWQQVVAAVFSELPTAGQTIFPELWAHFAKPEHWQVDGEVAPLWRRLIHRGLRIGIASNFDERLEPLCRQLSPLDLAECVFHSAQLGARKPGAKFFDAIQQQLDLPPGSLLMVGDDLLADYWGAVQAGWQAVWLDRAASAPTDCRHRITRLGQLADLLLAD